MFVSGLLPLKEPLLSMQAIIRRIKQYLLVISKRDIMPLTSILSIGLDLSLLVSRAVFLGSAGYGVISALSLKEAVNYLQTAEFGLVILCRSIPAKDRERLTCLIRASGLSIPVVSITEAAGHHDAYPDATFEEGDQTKLLKGIKEITTRSTKRKKNPAV